MSFKLIHVLFISVALLCGQTWGSNPFANDEGTECSRAGFVCDGCSVSNICHQLANGTWVKEFVEDCTLNQRTCQESTGICTSEINEPCTEVPPVEFHCSDAGAFPDPYNCSTYHLCIREPNGSFSRHTEHCAEGIWFNTLSLTCSVKATGNCIPPVPACRRTGSGSVRGSPTMYHLCVPVVTSEGNRVYAPRLYQCSGTLRYLRGTCFDPSSTQLGIVDGVCATLGNLYLPNCLQYNQCTLLGIPPLPRVCAASAFFNTTSEQCEFFSCNVFNPKF